MQLVSKRSEHETPISHSEGPSLPEVPRQAHSFEKDLLPQKLEDRTMTEEEFTVLREGCYAFVEEQSCIEWDEKVIAEQAEKLLRFVLGQIDYFRKQPQ
jgi:hypothetical protein